MRRWLCLTGWAVLLLGRSAAAQSAAEESYRLDPASSELHWLVYKAGAFAKLGHNHVISVGKLEGEITLNGTDLASSRFELTIPVDGLVVDDPMLRSGLGADFESVPTADDIMGTRANMLGDKVLDAEKFPAIHITGTGPIGSGAKQTLRVTVEILGRLVELTVPTKAVVTDSTVEASGEFELTHEQLGMKPFSVALGALSVGDKMTFSYHIRARRG
jgi:polyisoprenoid-binding protein YceI